MDPTRLQSTKCMTCQQHYDDDNDDDHHHQYSNQLNIQKNHHHSSFRHRLQRIFLPSSPPPPQPLSPLLISSPTMPTNVTMPIPKPYLPVQNRKSLTLTSNTTTKSSSYCDGTIIGEDEMIFPMSDITEEDEEHYQSDTNNNNTKIEYNQQKSDKDLSSSSSSLLAQSKYQSKKPTDSIDSSNGEDISTTISGSATTIKTKSKPIGIIPKISVVPFLRKRSTSDHHSDDEDGQSVDDSQRPDATTSIAASSSSSSLSWKSGSSSGVKAETITSSTATTSAKSKAHELLGKMMTRVTSSSSSSAPKSACNDNRQMLNNRIRCTSPPSTAITSNGRDDDDYNVYHTVHGHPHDNSSNHKVSINSPINYDGLFQPTQTKQPQSNSRTRSHSNVGFSQQMRHSTLMPGRIGIGSSSNRRQSHDYSHSNDIDNGHRSSPNYIQNNSLFDSFRPRSNTEGSRHSNQQINGNNSNVKKTSVMSVFKNNFLNRHSPSPSMTSGTSHNVECTPIDPSINVNLQPTSRNICQTTTRIIDHQPITLSSLSSSSSSSSTSARRRSSAYSRDSGIISAPISPNSVIDPFSVDYTLYNACMRADQSQSTLINNQPHLHHHCHHSNDINNALSNNKLLTTSLNINSNNRPRSRSSSASTMARVFDMFRNRSNSISSTDQPQIIRNRRSNKSNFNHQDSLCDRFEFEDIDENLVYVRFFKFYRCYDIIPVSAKLVVFDTQLAVKKAFFALLSNGIRAAPLWDASKHMFIGMLTVTDFINILLTYYHSPQLKMEELQEHTLDNWRSLLNEKARPLVSVEPDESLFNAIRTLLNNKVHRLPVIDPDTGNVLYILTHKRILKFLFLFYYNRLPMPSYLHKTLRELPQIGTFENIVTATLQTPLTEALSLLIESRISALPIVDKKNKVIDVYAKFDVIHLAADKTYQNLDITVKKALEFRNQSERVIKCNINETLHTILERIVQAEVHRIVVVDMDDHVIGIISLSDLLNFLVLRPVSAKHPLSSDIAITKSTLVEESGEESHGTASVCSHFDEDDIDEDDKRISNTIDNCQLTVSSVGSVLGTASSSSGQCSSSTSSSSSLLCANDDNNNNSKNKNNNKINNKSSSKNDNKVVDSTAKKIYSSAVDTTPDSDTTLRA